MKLGPEGTAVSSSKLGLLSLATMGAGALAGFIGFGNGLLFATMLIVGLGHPTQEGTATACASTSVLMSAVFLVYVQQLRGWMLKYIGVAVASSMVGAYTGCAFASSLTLRTTNPSSTRTSYVFIGRLIVVRSFVNWTLVEKRTSFRFRIIRCMRARTNARLPVVT